LRQRKEVFLVKLSKVFVCILELIRFKSYQVAEATQKVGRIMSIGLLCSDCHAPWQHFSTSRLLCWTGCFGLEALHSTGQSACYPRLSAWKPPLSWELWPWQMSVLCSTI